MDMDELKKKISECTKCRLHEDRDKTVPGEGPLDADIMLIGEGPGADEDAQGKPFVGSAGKKLNECLEGAGLKRKDVFITNTVRCRPPKNRDPRKDELDACDPYTQKMIELVNPKVIGLLGRIPTLQLTGQGTVGKARGKQITVKGMTYIPTFHPAALIYDSSRREVLINDLRSMKEYVEMEKKSRQTVL